MHLLAQATIVIQPQLELVSVSEWVEFSWF